MRLVLDGWSAYQYWMSVAQRPPAMRHGPHSDLTSFEEVSCRALASMLARADGQARPLELIVRGQSERRQSNLITCRSLGSTRSLPPNSMYTIGDGLYVVSPELLVLRLATQLPYLEFLRAFTDLMGIFAFAFDSRQDLVSRKPILTKGDLRSYLSCAQQLPGSKLVSRTINHVVERSASPRETSMDLELSLPTKAGGQGMPPFEANREFKDLPEEAKRLIKKSYLVADAAWPDDGPVIEYNSSKHHDTEEQKEFDFDKIAAMQCAGRTVIPLSTHNYNSYDSFAVVVQRVRKLLGHRDRYSDAVEGKRRDLHERLLHIERVQRESASLSELACWNFLLPRLLSEGEF